MKNIVHTDFAPALYLLFLTLFMQGCANSITEISGEMRVWYPLTLTLEGPGVDESESTFTDYRLDVTFSKGNKSFKVSGFYAADGNAAETSATSGNKWRAIFTPDEAGTWDYTVSFRTGEDIAISFDPNAGTPIPEVDGLTGSFRIKPGKNDEPGFFAKGKLNYAGEHFGQFAGSKEWHVKAGPGSPEDFFGYKDFDNTMDWHERRTNTQIADSFLVKLNGEGLHYYTPHVADWKDGDPTWNEGKGKGIIGALNYMASIGVNALYIIPYTIHDDADNTWPWTHRDSIMSYDVSKLAQWDIVFSHMDYLGISPNYYLCESDNSLFLDRGNLILANPIYYREIIARFGYHLGMRFNLGEELQQTGPQQAAAAEYLKTLDPYNTIIAGHSSHVRDEQVIIFEHLSGNENYDGPNYQLHENERRDHLDLIMWRDRSVEAGHKWIVSNDESWGINNTTHGENRMLTYVWRTHMAGAEGMFQYTAYNNPEIGDITMENFRLIENTQRIHIAAKDLFFNPEINPFLPQMRNENALMGNPTGNDAPFCFAKKGELYIVYRTSDQHQTPLDLTGATGVFTVHWYNALEGGDFQNGSVTTVTGGGSVHLGDAPAKDTGPWAIVLSKMEHACADEKTITASATGFDGSTVTGARGYCLNTTASLTANAAPGSEFVNWTENGVEVSTENPYLFAVTDHRSLAANFKKSDITSIRITTTESSPTEGITTGSGDYQINEVVTVSAIPNACYRFNNWTENGEIVSREPDYSFQVKEPRHLRANFTIRNFRVAAEPDEGGKVTGQRNYQCGSVIRIKAIPNAGYKFDGWFAGDKLISTQLQDDINIGGGYQLNARFSLDQP